MIGSYFSGLDVLYHRAKFGEIELRAPAVGAKMWCLYVFVCHAPRPARCLSRGAYFERALRRGLWIDFMPFSAFCRRDLTFRRTRQF